MWRPFDIDGDRLLIFREGLLLTTDLQGESQGNIANLPSIFTHSGLLAGDFVLVDAPELDEPTSIERYAVSDAGRARFDTSIEVEAEQVVILDHTDDAERVIVLDLRVRNFNEPDALVFIDFERSTQVSLSSPSVAGATAAGRSAWFSEDGKLVYALFADAPGSALRLFVAPIDSSDAVPGVEWTEIATWEDATSADAPPPDLRPMPWRDERFLYVGRDGGIFAVEPVFDS